MSVISVLGWLLIGVLALIGVAVVAAGLWIWRCTRAADHACSPLDACPAHFVLQRTATTSSRSSAARLMVEEIGANRIGNLELNTQVGNLSIELSMPSTRQVLVTHVSAPDHGEWLMTHRIRPDGRLDTWTNAYNRFHAAWSPGAQVVHWPGAQVEQLFDAARGSAPSQRMFPTELRALRDLYGREIVDSWVSRYVRGPGDFSWSDLMAYQPAQALNDEQWRQALAAAAPRKLSELCAAGFVYSSELPVQTWAEHRERLLFVHEHMPASSLDTVSDWHAFLHVSDALSKALAKLSAPDGDDDALAMDAIEQANASLPDAHRYLCLARFGWPLQGAVYAAPAPARSWLDCDEDEDEDELGAVTATKI